MQQFLALTAASQSEPEDEDENDVSEQAEEQDAEYNDCDGADDKDMETSDEVENSSKPEITEKRKRKMRLKKLRKSKARAYEFTGGGKDVLGILYLEIQKITDLPPERNSRLNEMHRIVLEAYRLYISDKNIFRYGSVCSGLPGSQDLSNTGHSTQPQPHL